MLAAEKQAVWDLLKTASSSLCAYVPRAFAETPAFSDDAESAASAEASDRAAYVSASFGRAGDFANKSAAAPSTQTSASFGRAGEFTDAGQADHASAESGWSGITLEEVAQKVASCSRCALSKKRTHTVPGMGVPHPAVLVVGEGPGAEEDAQGLPFVGPAGKLLDKMLEAISLSRDTNCYIANIVKCRPPNNRTPLPEEADACISFLEAQIHILKPKLILAAGRTAAQNLLKTTEALSRLRGAFRDYNGIPLLVTYHPSALLRDVSLKRPAWEDLKLFRAELLRLVPDYAKDFIKK